MELEDVTGAVRDSATVRRVFGEPIQAAGTTIIPVAKVVGGAGGGGGRGTSDGGRDAAGAVVSGPAATQGEGYGRGFGTVARPVGVVVIRDGDVAWRPTLDLTRVVLGGQLVLLVALLVCRSIVKVVARAEVSKKH